MGDLDSWKFSDLDDLDENRSDSRTTLAPSEISVDLPENWDQAKDDSQSLFLNKSDKNDLEPYPMALSDDCESFFFFNWFNLFFSAYTIFMCYSESF